nr:MAG TPA: hypothetical protein [Caudoviricetes sp.]
MDGIEERYGDLTDKEYLEFLSEIEEKDIDIEEAQCEAIEKIELEEEHTELSESEENARIEAYYGNDAWRKFGQYFFSKPAIIEAYKKAQRTREAKRRKLKEDRIAIQRMAFSQDYLRLSDPIGNDNLKLLITLLTSEHTKMVEKYAAYINKRLTILINPLIPRRLRICKMIYPEAMKECPGFLYKASKEYGEGQTFWAMPDIPYYFKQNTEQAELQKSIKYTNYLINIDKAIASHNMHNKVRAEKELKYASMIIRKGVYSYFDLLRLNPFWFEILFNSLKSKIDSL